MIALCAKHHAAADRNTYRIAYLQSLKKKDYSKQELREVFPWAEKDVLVRLGRFYIGGASAIMPVRCDPILKLERDDDGLLLMTFTLVGDDGTPLISMDRNQWTGTTDVIHDLVVNTAGTDIRVWHGKRDVGLQLSFDRLSPSRFDRLLEADTEASRGKLDQLVSDWLKSTNADQAAAIAVQKAIEKLQPPHGLLPNDWGSAYHRIVSTMEDIRNWAKQYATDEQGNVVLLNIENLVAYNYGRRIEIRNSNSLGDPVVVESCVKAGFTAVFP